MSGDEILTTEIHQQAQRLLRQLERHVSELCGYDPDGEKLARDAAEAVERVLRQPWELNSK